MKSSTCTGNMFKHVCFCSLALTLEHPSNYSLGAHLTQVAALPATEPRAALAYPSWQRHPARAAHRYLPRLDTHNALAARCARIAKWRATSFFFKNATPMVSSTTSTETQCVFEWCTASASSSLASPSSSSSPSKKTRTRYSCPRERSRSRGPQRRSFAAMSAGRQQRAPSI